VDIDELAALRRRYPPAHFHALIGSLLVGRVFVPQQRVPGESINDAIERTTGRRPKG